MSRITTVSNETANIEQRNLLDAIQSQLGMVPNFLRVFANSPDALKAFLGLHHIANHGSLDSATRERIAVALAQQNECEYCLSAHTAIGRKAGLNGADIVEVITHVGMNVLTNILGKASRVNIDFPKVALKQAA